MYQNHMGKIVETQVFLSIQKAINIIYYINKINANNYVIILMLTFIAAEYVFNKINPHL